MYMLGRALKTLGTSQEQRSVMRMCWPTSRTRATTTPAMASSVCAGGAGAVTAWDKLQLVRAACQKKKCGRGRG